MGLGPTMIYCERACMYTLNLRVSRWQYTNFAENLDLWISCVCALKYERGIASVWRPLFYAMLSFQSLCVYCVCYVQEHASVYIEKYFNQTSIIPDENFIWRNDRHCKFNAYIQTDFMHRSDIEYAIYEQLYHTERLYTKICSISLNAFHFIFSLAFFLMMWLLLLVSLTSRRLYMTCFGSHKHPIFYLVLVPLNINMYNADIPWTGFTFQWMLFFAFAPKRVHTCSTWLKIWEQLIYIHT